MRAYKHKKFNPDNYTQYGINPKYFGRQAARFPKSLKTQYCNIHEDYYDELEPSNETTFTLRRNPAVGKGTGCKISFNPAPGLGPVDLAAEVIAPYAGPSSLVAYPPTPDFGPTGLIAGIKVSSAGPAMLNASVVAPAQGPSGLSVSSNPAVGPSNLRSTTIIPSSFNIMLKAEILNPLEGPEELSLASMTDTLYYTYHFQKKPTNPSIQTHADWLLTNMPTEHELASKIPDYNITFQDVAIKPGWPKEVLSIAGNTILEFKLTKGGGSPKVTLEYDYTSVTLESDTEVPVRNFASWNWWGNWYNEGTQVSSSEHPLTFDLKYSYITEVAPTFNGVWQFIPDWETRVSSKYDHLFS